MTRRLYLVTYPGLYLGGKAIVYASSISGAIEAVAKDRRTVNLNPDQCTATLLRPTKENNGVMFNENGDY